MAAFTFTSCDTLYLPRSGGKKMQFMGVWPLATPISIYIGPTGTTTDPVCYSGKPGQAYTLYALQSGLLVAHAPSLPRTITTANLLIVCGANTYVSPNAFAVRPDQFYSQVYSLRSVLPPKYATGPRTITSETPP